MVHKWGCIQEMQDLPSFKSKSKYPFAWLWKGLDALPLHISTTIAMYSYIGTHSNITLACTVLTISQHTLYGYHTLWTCWFGTFHAGLWSDAWASMGDQHGKLCQWRRLLSLLIQRRQRMWSNRTRRYLCAR